MAKMTTMPTKNYVFATFLFVFTFFLTMSISEPTGSNLGDAESAGMRDGRFHPRFASNLA